MSDRLPQVKFAAAIFPNDRLTLTLSSDPAKGRLRFECRRGEQACSSGQIAVTP